jgi:hypothetical protein
MQVSQLIQDLEPRLISYASRPIPERRENHQCVTQDKDSTG